MVEIKSIQLPDTSLLGMHLHLPGYPIDLIMSTKAILVQQMFDRTYFQKANDIAIIQIEGGHGFASMLASKVCAMNEYARKRHVKIGMSAKEALLICEKEDNA